MKVLTDNKYYGEIADVIREQNGTNNTYTPPQMVRALKDLFYEEVEGVPPISFNGIGENLLDYRIDGASGGVGDRTKNFIQNTATTQTKNGVTFTVNEDKSISCNGTAASNAFFKIGDIQLKENCIMSGCPAGGANNSYVMRLYNNGSVFKTDSGDGVLINSEIQNGYAEIRIAAGYTCDNLTFYPMIRLAEIEDNTYEPYGYKVPVVISGKNLLPTPEVKSQTVNGVTFTVNNDKSITCNGTATGTAAITINTIFSINSTKISGCPMGGSWSSFELDLLNINTNNVDVIDTGNGAVIQNENSYRVRIRIASGYTCNNLTFYPMIRKADIEDDTYEPYIEPTTTNIYLDEPIEARANIPSEYTEVEYLESTGTQYIDTGFVPNSNSGFKTKIVFSGYSDGIDDFIIGLRSNSNYGRFAYTCTDFNNITFYCSFGTTTSSSYRYNSNMPTTEIIECELNYKNSNTTITQGVEGLLPDKNNFIGEGLSFYLAGAYNARGNPKYKAMRQYKCELTQGTEVVRDLVPCYRNSDNVAGLYDLVNNVFYTNQGTGNFIVGSIKENESISLSDTNTNIPTIRGTNVLTVDTTVQPSNVYVKSRKESQYEIALRQYYESIINS